MTRIEEDRIVRLPKANVRKSKDKVLGEMWSTTRKILDDFYEPHNLLLSQILHNKNFTWSQTINQSNSSNSNEFKENLQEYLTQSKNRLPYESYDEYEEYYEDDSK